MKKISIPTVTMAAFILLFSRAFAAGPTLTQVHDLNFGLFGMHDNKSVHTITVSPDGTVVADPVFAFAIQPQAGEYRLTEMPTNEALTIELSSQETAAPTVTTSPLFTVKDFTANNPVTTDGSGNALVLVGASLLTSGAGPYYQTDSYTGSYDLTIIY